MVKQFHGPLIAAYAAQVGLGDEQLAADCQQGFPTVGLLPEFECGAQLLKKVTPSTSKAKLRALRKTTDREMIARFKDSEEGETLARKSREDAEKHYMTMPRPSDAEDIEQVTLTRRLCVQEYRPS